MQGKHDSKWAYLIGTGIALSPIHNVWLTSLATNSQGEPWLFLPQLGFLAIFIGAGRFVVRNWERIQEQGFGDRRLVAGLGLIVLAIALSGINFDGLARLVPLGAGVLWILLYLASRILGEKIMIPLAVGTAIASISVITYAVIHPGQLTGGYVFEGNYDIVIGYILLGAALYSGRWRIPLIALSVVAVFLTGSPEGIIALLVLGIVVIIRKDWGKPLFAVLVPLIIVIAVWFGLGWGQELYGYATDIVKAEVGIETETPAEETPRIKAVSYRLETIGTALRNTEPLGEGYNLTEFREGIVHNVPLVIVQQLGWPGVLAGVCWLVIGVWGWRNRRWRYSWTLMLVLSVFDHFTWTQMAPYWWLLIGVSSVMSDGTDRICGRS